MSCRLLFVFVFATLAVGVFAAERAFPPAKLDVLPKPIASDPTVRLDYPIVYVRAPRFVVGTDGKQRPSAWPEIGHPTNINAGYDLMLLHPDGKEEVLVEGGEGSVADPYVSFDAEWVFYAYFYLGKLGSGSDVYKIHVKTKKVVRLTHQESTPNTGCLAFRKAGPPPAVEKLPIGQGVWNLGPCPAPGGRLVFTSTRDGVKVPRGYPRVANQLHVMDDDGKNVEKIGYLNVGSALHPVVLKDGRVMFSSLESQGVHGAIAWGVWSIHPDGANWEPIISALFGHGGADNGFHFQTQLSDGNLVIEEYYNQNTLGFGTYVKLPPRAPKGTPQFGPAYLPPVVHTKEFGWDIPELFMRGRGSLRMPFAPYGLETLTRFTHGSDFPAPLSDEKDPKSPRVGKLTHPCGAPDNHLLTVWAGGSAPSANRGPVPYDDPVDAGIYLIKGGKPVLEPGQMLLIKNDPKYNEQWPRALVPYERIYGIKEPARLEHKNDGKKSPHLPEGTPFGLVGTSSLYKRESFPRGQVPKGSVTATGNPYNAFSYSMSEPPNWGGQGADAGLYENSDIHAIRILAMEPATQTVAGRFHNHAQERLRILGEIPVRKFGEPGASATGGQPKDPDGNNDTSFLAKIPADVAFTFQTIDKDGMVLNMAQTWHQLRPGEVRNNCGGCHAHSQQPTEFKDTAAARPDYQVFDLTRHTPLLTTKKDDQSGKKWNAPDQTGLRFDKTVKDVEYHRDVKPIFQRSCAACHSGDLEKPAGKLVLNDDRMVQGPRWDLGNTGPVPATWNTLAGNYLGVTHYVHGFQSRRSLLIWKVFGKRLDGLPEKPVPGHEAEHKKVLAEGDFTGSAMPPPEAVQSGKVKPLSDEDRRTLVRWIDLGCPVDLSFDAKEPGKRGDGWLFDDQRPTLTLTYPAAGANAELSRILVGMHDYGTGLDMDSFQVAADFALDRVDAGQNLAPKFKEKSPGVWELTLSKPLTQLPKSKLTVSVKDRQGNLTRIERTFAVGTLP
jgi:Hydrazine synthase alpha subunit middle domain